MALVVYKLIKAHCKSISVILIGSCKMNDGKFSIWPVSVQKILNPFPDFRALIVLCFCTLVPSGGLASSSCAGQSPINIITTNVLPEDPKPLRLERWNTELSGEYKNTGYTVKFTPSRSAMVIKGTRKYKVCQFHIHWGASSNVGSEHLIDSRAYAGELHIVSVKDTLRCEDAASFKDCEDALVVGVFLTAVNTPIVDTVWEELSPVPQKYGQIQKMSVELSRLLPDDKSYYFYEGSLTTDPYNEIVQWHVLKHPIEIPEEYLFHLRSILDKNGTAVDSNYRPTQPVQERSVSVCTNKNCLTSVMPNADL